MATIRPISYYDNEAGSWFLDMSVVNPLLLCTTADQRRAFALPLHDPAIASQHAVRRDQITSGRPSYTNAILIASRGAERTGDNSVSLTLSFILIVR